MPSQDKIRVLVVDDIAETRDIIRRQLQFDQLIEVVGLAGSGREAIDLSQKTKPDVILMDMVMPDMNGATATRTIRQQFPKVQVIALTSFKEEELVKNALEAGAIGYLVKPFRSEELGPAIEVAIKRFRDLQAAGNEVEELKRALETRKILDRAKAHLMNTQGMSEDEAFKFIHFGARNSSRTMRDIAIEVLQKAGQQV